jgi:hemoglobin-like flavoprotein
MSGKDDVRASYERCLKTGDLAATFYERFFTKSPEIPKLFAKTDFTKQKQHFRSAVQLLIKHTPGDPATTAALNKIGQTHSRDQYNIRPDLYPFFVESFREAIKLHDAEWTAELEQQWLARASVGINVVVSLYDAPDPSRNEHLAKV